MTREELSRRYKMQTLAAIAASEGVSVRTVYTWLDNHGIPRRGNAPLSDTLTEDRLRTWTQVDGLSVSQIARALGRSRSAVQLHLDRLGLRAPDGRTSDGRDSAGRETSTPADHKRASELYARTRSTSAVAQALGINKRTAAHWIRLAGIQIARQGRPKR